VEAVEEEGACMMWDIFRYRELWLYQSEGALQKSYCIYCLAIICLFSSKEPFTTMISVGVWIAEDSWMEEFGERLQISLEVSGWVQQASRSLHLN